MPYTSYRTKQKLRLRRHDPDTRAQLALRFRAMYQSLGLDLPGCAQLLHVSERTLHNWACGKHDILYATYRLLRLLNRMELPGQTWQGWSFHGHKLISPEGHVFVGTDSAWWGLLVRRAAMFGKPRRADGDARPTALGMRSVPGAGGGEAPRLPAAAGGRREAPALDLSTRHFGTYTQQNQAACGFPGHLTFSYQPLLNARKELP